MRKTKIICTIGPASENEETLKQLCLAGLPEPIEKITMIVEITNATKIKEP